MEKYTKLHCDTFLVIVLTSLAFCCVFSAGNSKVGQNLKKKKKKTFYKRNLQNTLSLRSASECFLCALTEVILRVAKKKKQTIRTAKKKKEATGSKFSCRKFSLSLSFLFSGCSVMPSMYCFLFPIPHPGFTVY